MTRPSSHADKAQFWRDVFSRWRCGGLSIRAFCRQRHLAQASFYYWRRILAEPVRSEPVDSTPTPPPVNFLPIHVRDDSPIQPAVLELVLDNGRQLRIPAGFDLDTLRGVLDLLEDRPCST